MAENEEGRQLASLANKTLEEIDGQKWPLVCCASYIENTTGQLRKKPLGQFTPEDLRIMIAQDIGAEVLKPFALAVLRDNPLAEGDYYPGDLLEAATKRWPDDAFLRDLAAQHSKS
ncbi:contact-dependent growth inhibition system immunity protein [Aliiroseovarius subalbicans]|uniref:contact-dependent growth inhibition system immunity protein n=1 Tax=Aliiroseovarius subalbicans TaxID=2925840 RepID=UPI001F5844AA|nr:contact-dependent growth inhibition system immunity protein [Aliiroseovarius subalbicans]MCI2398531.1 contact-dependent growth inhibition system immunity protein [Aliiroseovarius subalbicans]